MFLSRLLLQAHNRLVQRDVGDVQQLHRTVMSAFPAVGTDTAGAREKHGILFRVEPELVDGALQLLVQSKLAPQWVSLPPGYLAPATAGVPNLTWKELDLHYSTCPEGSSFHFRLQANVTKRIADGGRSEGRRKPGRRVALGREDEQAAWLERQSASHGFRVQAARISGAHRTYHGCRPDAGVADAHCLTFAGVLFDGLLEVTDPTLFRDALERGIGPGKAYGFGLLSIAPVR